MLLASKRAQTREEDFRMKLMESAGLLFPVMTSRVDDLRAAAQYVIRRMEAHPGREKPDSDFVKLLQKYLMKEPFFTQLFYFCSL